jgi:hypothetical protein
MQNDYYDCINCQPCKYSDWRNEMERIRGKVKGIEEKEIQRYGDNE